MKLSMSKSYKLDGAFRFNGIIQNLYCINSPRLEIINFLIVQHLLAL
ncbi:unnamed protein product, partial [Tenebrio molitor]